MDEFRWIQMFLCLMLMIQIAVSVNETSMFMKVGGDVTLLCLNVIDEQNNCDGTTWIFASRNKETVELITLGQIGEEAETKSDRLSVTANCSLLIKKLTVDDVGFYYCQQYKVEETPSKHTLVHQSLVDLSVITLTEHKDTDKVTLSCSVVTYEQCHHTVKWLLKGQAVEKENKQIVTSQTDCSTTLSFLEHHYFNSSRHKILKFEVTDTKTGKVQLFTFSRQTSGEETGVQWFIIPAVGLVSLLIIVVVFIRWKRTRGNKTQMDEDAGLSLNPAETRSAPQTSQDSGWAYRVYLTSRPMVAGIGSSPPSDPDKDKQKRMDEWTMLMWWRRYKYLGIHIWPLNKLLLITVTLTSLI
ncbi:uncharacterized protein LOC120433103 isoform X2 [Oreochromis aureus]|uniref:uncharacterized protein LOC120433103 isoform X2 n=1 Tax=Oreochromis aureus TaxID=47969 RepID=UPI001954CE18|nr:uncharacterized protein LOC120433103 isoform X2 [Oreochromis aureus]